MAEKYKLNAKDMGKIGKGALIAGGGAVLVYLVEILPQVEFGAWTAAAVATGGILINLARKWLVKI